jgi:hypothetical protein
MGSMSSSTLESWAGRVAAGAEIAVGASALVDVSLLGKVDFAGHGLFWDRPGMGNEQFLRILADPDHPEHRWAWTRALEWIPSRVITQAVSLSDLRRLIRLVRLRPPLQKAWESAIDSWTEESRRRVA